MKNILLFKILFIAAIFSSLSAKSQEEKSAYAVTDSVRDGLKWNFLRTVDLRTGTYSRILLRLLANSELSAANPANTFVSNGVAAIAHDKKNKRLYYTPMLIDRLSYIDLKTMRTYIVTNNFTRLMPKAADQSNIITRMVIAGDEKGYALTNDGRHLIRFTTKNNPGITDLGSLVDAPRNNEMSVHNSCRSFGGDIIADDDGHLYLFTVGNHVYKIDIGTKIARYLGTLTGIPATFTTSGAAVDHHNKIVIVSSTDASDVYTVDIRTLAARRLNANNPWRTADLANTNILETDDHHIHTDHTGSLPDRMRVFPNPVTAGEFRIQFDNLEAGKYTVEVIDANGRLAVKKEVNVDGKINFISVSLPGSISKGLYLVRMSGHNHQPVCSDIIIVE
jgi:Secretion system C-terminal sorting domain